MSLAPANGDLSDGRLTAMPKGFSHYGTGLMMVLGVNYKS